jgi:curved DNA-binding protein CbpA
MTRDRRRHAADANRDGSQPAARSLDGTTRLLPRARDRVDGLARGHSARLSPPRSPLHHPDLNSGDAQAVDRARRINEAYAVLHEPSLPTAYDPARTARGHGGRSGGVSNRNPRSRGSGSETRTRVRNDAFQDHDTGWTIGDSGWTVCVGDERTETAARMLLGLARRDGMRATILATSDHPDLIPGRWIVFSGWFESRAPARRAARRVARKIEEARCVYPMAE